MRLPPGGPTSRTSPVSMPVWSAWRRSWGTWKGASSRSRVHWPFIARASSSCSAAASTCRASASRWKNCPPRPRPRSSPTPTTRTRRPGEVQGEGALTQADPLETWLAAGRAWIEGELERWLASSDDGTPEGLLSAMRYAVLGGGKRLRPALVRLCCDALGGSDAECAPAAVAVELIHAYSLVHDDLPCMDDDDLRRGRPTCHKVFGEAMAVLAADALQAEAFEVLASADDRRARESTRALARAAGAVGMVGGQALDMTLSAGALEAEKVRDMHARKTGALFACAAELGAI